MSMNVIEPINLEDYFQPGLKAKPAVFVGSQTSDFIKGIAEEQAWEGFFLGAARPGDVTVIRNFDPSYIDYWQSLMGNSQIINLPNDRLGEFLTQVILESTDIQNQIKTSLARDAKLQVFFPTEFEQRLAEILQIPLHGNYQFSSRYGVKSGGRSLAHKANVPIPEGYICNTRDEIKNAVNELLEKYPTVVLKHDNSFSGYFSKRMTKDQLAELNQNIDEISAGNFTEGKDIVVAEGWLKSKASLCAHIEIVEGQNPVICAGWQQVIEDDGISYMGAGPLRLSQKAFDSFYGQVKQFAQALKEEGAVGSFGPDFLITADDETHVEPDSSVLIELNARIPYTAVPLEIVKDVRGKIGAGFLAKHIHVKSGTKIEEILRLLADNNLLITKKDTQIQGVVPYNVGVLPWGIFDVVAMANSWEETQAVMKQVDSLFSR